MVQIPILELVDVAIYASLTSAEAHNQAGLALFYIEGDGAAGVGTAELIGSNPANAKTLESASK